ncbi:MAG: hypothetical protein AB8B96_01675 [Lysobacterales bacterium]
MRHLQWLCFPFFVLCLTGWSFAVQAVTMPPAECLSIEEFVPNFEVRELVIPPDPPQPGFTGEATYLEKSCAWMGDSEDLPGGGVQYEKAYELTANPSSIVLTPEDEAFITANNGFSNKQITFRETLAGGVTWPECYGECGGSSLVLANFELDPRASDSQFSDEDFSFYFARGGFTFLRVEDQACSDGPAISCTYDMHFDIGSNGGIDGQDNFRLAQKSDSQLLLGAVDFSQGNAGLRYIPLSVEVPKLPDVVDGDYTSRGRVTDLSQVVFVNGEFALKLGSSFFTDVTLRNSGNGPLINPTVVSDEDPALFRQVSGPTPPFPAALERRTNFSTTYEFETLSPGRYRGFTTISGSSQKGVAYSRTVEATGFVVVDKLAVRVVLPAEETARGEVFPVEVRVSLVEDDPIVVSFDGGVLTSASDLVEIPLVNPEPFELTAANPSAQFEVMVTAKDEGSAELVSRVTGIQVDSAITEASDSDTVEIAGIKVVAVEMTQVIQNWRNSINLTEGKPTYVRAHLTGSSDEDLSLVLHGKNASTDDPLPGSPLVPLFDPRPQSNARTDAARRRYYSGALFALPDTWTTGPIDVEVASTDPEVMIICADEQKDCEARGSFRSRPVGRFNMTSINIGDFSVPLRVRADMVDRLISATPFKEVIWSATDMIWPEATLPDPWEVTPYLAAQRAMDFCFSPFCNTIYYGAIPGSAVSGYAEDIPGEVAAGNAPSDPQAIGRHTHTHEIGHLLGRSHSVSSQFGAGEEPNSKLGPCGSEATGDTPDFPYIEAASSPNLFDSDFYAALGPLQFGVPSAYYGYDALQKRIVSPFSYSDLMSYCSRPIIDLWPAENTYRALINDLTNYFVTGIDPPVPASDYLMALGRIDNTTGAATLYPPIFVPNSPEPSQPPPGDYNARFLDSAGAELATVSFQPATGDRRGDPAAFSSFLIGVPANGDIRQLEIERNGVVLATATGSDNPPQINLLTPNGGENITGDIELRWSASDLDGDPLLVTVQYSPDNGTNWQTLAINIPQTQLDIPAGTLPGSASALFRLMVSDGFDVTTDQSDQTFQLRDSAPLLAISDPAGDVLVKASNAFEAVASVYDLEQGTNLTGSMTWTSSIDGELASGGRLLLPGNTLSPGVHVLTASVQDSAGNLTSESRQVTVSIELPTNLAETEIIITQPAENPLAATPLSYEILVSNLGPAPATDLDVSFNVLLTTTDGEAPAIVQDVSPPAGWQCSQTGQTVNCSTANLEEEEVTLLVKVRPTTAGTMTAFAALSSANPERTLANNDSRLELLIGNSDRVFGDGFE